MAKTFGNFIGGEWVPAGSKKTFENRNPADTSEVVGVFADSGPEDVERGPTRGGGRFPPPSAGRSCSAPPSSSCAARRTSRGT